MIDAAKKLPLTTDYQKLEIDPSYSKKACVPMCIWIDDVDIAFTLAQDSSGTGARKINANDSWCNSCVNVDSDGFVCYAKAASGTPNLYCDPGRL